MRTRETTVQYNSLKTLLYEVISWKDRVCSEKTHEEIILFFQSKLIFQFMDASRIRTRRRRHHRRYLYCFTIFSRTLPVKPSVLTGVPVVWSYKLGNVYRDRRKTASHAGKRLKRDSPYLFVCCTLVHTRPTRSVSVRRVYYDNDRLKTAAAYALAYGRSRENTSFRIW